MVLPYITGTPEDVAVNTYHFNVPIVGLPAFEAITGALIDLYNEVPPGGATASLGSFITPYVDRTTDACQIKLYDAQAEGPPIGLEVFTLDGPSENSSLPFEVAVCGSYTAYTVGGNARRQRGRVYYGPFNLDALNAPADLPPSPTPSLRATIANGQEALAEDAALAAAEVFWGVYSRVGDVINAVTAGWVDNAFDTQRRREVEASVRENWSAA